MEYRTLGNSDVKVSTIVFGSWAIGGRDWGPQDDDDAVAAIRTAIDMGVTTIDTAAVYGFGHSESLVAKAVAGRRDQVQILTKYGVRGMIGKGGAPGKRTDDTGKLRPVYMNSRKDSVLAECEQSLRRLATDYIDLYQCHWRDRTTPVEETMAAVDQLLTQGKIRAAGVSNFTADEIEAARQVVPIVSVQPPYSMLQRGAEKDILPHCRANSISVLIYSPMQRGLLTGAFTPDRTIGPGDHRAGLSVFSVENRRRVQTFLDDIRPLAQAHNATLGQVAVNWALQQPGVTAALVGCRNVRQAEENCRAFDFKLTAEEIRQITDRLETLDLEL